MTADAYSAVVRAQSLECKQAIQKVSCLLQDNKLFPSALPRYCPLKGAYYYYYYYYYCYYYCYLLLLLLFIIISGEKKQFS